MKKVTIQDIADAAGVSRVTVWKVMNNQKGVSESTRKKIIDKASEMNYNGMMVSEPVLQAEIESPADPKVSSIAIIVARPESSVFWMKIINKISSELSKYNLHCIYVNLMREDFEVFKMPAILKNEDVQGVIIINAYEENVIRTLAQSRVPKVYMDAIEPVSFPEMNGDVFILDGECSVSQITEHIIHKGHKEIGFIGDIHYAISNFTRWQGYCSAMNKNNLPIQEDYCLISGFDIENYRENIEDFINRLKHLPEAFVCASDYIAYILISVLHQKGYRIPQDIVVSGYDNNREMLIEDNLLTTVNVQKSLLGKRLVSQLLYRINNPNADFEKISVHSKVCFKRSTEI